MTLALLDGDIIAFRAAAAVQKTFDWGDGVPSTTTDEDEAKAAAIDTCQAWADLARCRHLRVLFTGPHNFRHLVLPTYKGNRTKGKPLAYWATVRAVRERFECQEVDGLEADDLMGILMTTPRYEDSIVVTLDKDLQTIPGQHFNPAKDDRPRVVTEAQADRYHLYQTLVGDSTDFYKGCPAIGPKTADKLLNASASWGTVSAAFHKAGLTEADALQQARVARILRRSDYCKDTKTIRLWHPRGAHTPLLLDDVTRKAKPPRLAA